MTEVLNTIVDQLITTFSLEALIALVTTGDYEALSTWEGFKAVLLPIVPLSVLFELLVLLWRRDATLSAYKVNLIIYVVNRVLGRFVMFGVMLYTIKVLGPLQPFKVPMTWYGFIYGYIVFEFSQVLSHYLAHKVRLFWCLHSTHHAPRHMNLSVSYSHFILEYPYAEFIKVGVCLMAGVPLPMLLAAMAIDGVWGHLIHVGGGVMKNGRLGFLEKLVLTPSHHRAHHAKNPLYMDTNFGNLLPIWDRLFGTYQPQDESIEFEYGITRDVDSNSFWDVYVGEILHLYRDVVAAPGLANKLRYLYKPPGWHHDGEDKTASTIRREFLRTYRGPAVTG